ncbi:arginase [Uliginosibacterium gangwonense]|uniref:arginase n=1 Tax=Uliginosibacterium gangwonense TaxID=392736 RepID=UPI00036DA8FA|nr:arginase [Uliginosibacterium gangwonense]
MRPVSIIGVPTDVGASVIGARMGPEALRVAGIAQAVARYGCQVQDCGDVRGPANPVAEAINGFRHLDEVVAWNHAVYQAVYEQLNRGRLPLMMGGDHSLAIGSISAVARHCREQGKKLRVLWFDAHADFNTSAITPSGNIHGMPVACLCGHGPRALVEMSGSTPAIRPAQVRQIGIRSVDEGEKRFLRDEGVPVFDMRCIDEIGMRHTLELALEGIDANTHLHVSLDVDFLDPNIAPGVGTAVRGGPNYREAQLCMEMIADTGYLASLDLVELNPALDTRNMTAELAVDLIESLFGKSTLLTRRDPDSPHAARREAHEALQRIAELETDPA